LSSIDTKKKSALRFGECPLRDTESRSPGCFGTPADFACRRFDKRLLTQLINRCFSIAWLHILMRQYNGDCLVAR
jgi:hypothetical protein